MSTKSGWIKVRVRTPEGGESAILLEEDSMVDDLRRSVQWCIENKDWSCRRSIPVKKAKKRIQTTDEMWTLNDPSSPCSDSSKIENVPESWGDPSDFETIMSNSCEVHNCERKSVELLFGAQILEVHGISLATFRYVLKNRDRRSQEAHIFLYNWLECRTATR